MPRNIGKFHSSYQSLSGYLSLASPHTFPFPLFIPSLPKFFFNTPPPPPTFNTWIREARNSPLYRGTYEYISFLRCSGVTERNYCKCCKKATTTTNKRNELKKFHFQCSYEKTLGVTCLEAWTIYRLYRTTGANVIHWQTTSLRQKVQVFLLQVRKIRCIVETSLPFRRIRISARCTLFEI